MDDYMDFNDVYGSYKPYVIRKVYQRNNTDSMDKYPKNIWKSV